MSEKELKEIMEVTTPARAEGVILGKYEGKAVCMPKDTRLNRHIAIFGASGTMKSRAVIRNALFQALNHVLMKTSQFLRRLEKAVKKQEIMDMAWSMVFGLLYVRYDTEKEFQPQFDRNAEELGNHIAAIERLGGAVS